jgi:hypothetical protein
MKSVELAPIEPSAPAAAIEATAVEDIPNLPIEVEHQKFDQWCWAAVATSVSHYYDAGSTWTQCLVAAAEVGASCCDDNLPDGCNRWWYLERALARTGNFSFRSESAWPLDDVRKDLRAQRPVGVRIEWANFSGHFIVIRGVHTGSDGLDYLHVSDPIYGSISQPAEELRNGQYQQQAVRWTHTYQTRG